MNKKLEQESLTNKIKAVLKKHYKILIYFIILIIVSIGLVQFYFFQINQKILKNSIQYNLIKSTNSIEEMNDELNELSKQKNFYSVLSSLEKIKIKLKNKELDSAYEDYLHILNNKKLDKLYTTSIAVHASYSLINFIDLNSNLRKNEKENIVLKIKELLSFIDNSLDFYKGFELELLYLLSILDYEMNTNANSYDQSKKLYQEIQDNDKIPLTLKERVKKIHEFQKYK